MFYITTSLIGPIWMTWNGSASTDMVQWPQTASVLAEICFQLAKCHKLWPSLKPKKVIGLAQNGHQEPVSHHNITHWTQMDDMKWFSINWYDVVTANSISFSWNMLTAC
jgi:hypothetical protein